MLGKIVGAIAGERLSRQIGGNGPAGALVGVVSAAMLRRMGPLGLAAAAVGGYALKRHFERKQTGGSAPTATGGWST